MVELLLGVHGVRRDMGDMWAQGGYDIVGGGVHMCCKEITVLCEEKYTGVLVGSLWR